MIRSARASRIAGVLHVHSERGDGAVGGVDAAAEARAACVRALGGDPGALVSSGQVHGSRVAVAHAADAGTRLAAADGLATATRCVPLLVQGADCPLVLLAAPGAAAVIHSGWRGTAARIAAEGVRVLGTLGAAPAEIAAAVFPGIGPCCFEVGPDVRDALSRSLGAGAGAWFAPGRAGTDRLLLDLTAAIRATLEASGVSAAAIEVVPGCTACDARFFSHRASRGAPERHGLFAMLG